MRRTSGAVLAAAAVTVAAIGGVGVFLGFEPLGSFAVGVAAGLLAGFLIWAAARRADTFHEPHDRRDEGGR